jgi:hypothetical protein
VLGAKRNDGMDTGVSEHGRSSQSNCLHHFMVVWVG